MSTDDDAPPPGAKIILWPPLPSVPVPPSFDLDPRQQTFRQVLGGLADGLSLVPVEDAKPRYRTGYPASAIDLGRLQDALASGIQAFSMADIEARRSEVIEWFLATLRGWVQRRKGAAIDVRANGIHVRVETQDDHGYYTYEFDVFPGRS